MKKLFKYLHPYNKAMWLALILTGVELAVELIQPILMAIIIDDGISKNDLSLVLKWGSVLLGLSVIAFLSGIYNTFYAAKVSQGVGHDIRRDLFNKIQHFSLESFHAFSSSSLITRMTNDVTQVQTLLFMALRIMLRTPLFIIGGMIMAISVHSGLALILVISVPVLILILIVIQRKGISLFHGVQKSLDTLNSVIRENLVAMRLVKVFVKGRHETERFKKINELLMMDNKRALRLMELTMPILLFGMNVSMVLIIWYGAIELNMGGAKAGEIVAVLNYATKILFAFAVFSFLLINYSRGQASATRIVEVLEVTQSNVHKEDDTNLLLRGTIEFEQVSFRYPYSEEDTLKNVSFKVKAGETIGILGETGSGKSTLFQLIPLLYEPTSGRILIDGKEIRDYSEEVLRRNIGFVPQEAHLFSGSIKENISWGSEDATDDEIMQAAKDAAIHEFIMSLPEQYKTNLGQKGVNISGGQKQRLSLARALVRKPKILLLDDSTSALDTQTEARILKKIESLPCTTLIIAQKISAVKDADRILIFKQGEIVAHGNHDTLLNSSPLYQDIYYSQVEEEVGQFVKTTE